MSRLLTRLQKLEGQLTDRSRHVPHTKAWWDYWIVRVHRLFAGEKLDEGELIPLEFMDALLASGDRQEQDEAIMPGDINPPEMQVTSPAAGQ